MIYFIQAAIVGRIKIGFTSRNKLANRVSQIQTGCPVPIDLLATKHGNRATEARLHERFASCRICGEWFHPSPELVRFVSRLQGKKQREKAPRKNRKTIASQWLIERFRERLEWSSDELFQAAGSVGLSRNAVFEARDVLSLPKARKVTTKSGVTSWVWRVPVDWAYFTDSSLPANGPL